MNLEFGVLGPPVLSNRFNVRTKICANFNSRRVALFLVEAGLVDGRLAGLGVFSWIKATALLLLECQDWLGGQST